MARQARVILPNTPHHIMQRGHNRQVVFASDEDFQYYRENLQLFKDEFCCKIYSYCLMTNHVHLIVNPGDNPESLSLLMKRVAGRQTRYVNKLEKRSGSLWEGRFKSSIISSQEYLISCSRYIELNPMRAGMVEDPSVYQWSSFSKKAKGKPDAVVDYDRVYTALGNTAAERQKAYIEYVSQTIPEDELKLLSESIQRNQVTGGNRFREQLEKKLKMKLSNRGPGRPRKVGK
ncbi:MAG: transposase [Desulfobulbaceae bacterium]|nr:transposase [Desulfobulbaceae bacterium]